MSDKVEYRTKIIKWVKSGFLILLKSAINSGDGNTERHSKDEASLKWIPQTQSSILITETWANSLTAISEILRQNHAAKLHLDSWPLKLVWDFWKIIVI